MYKIRKADILSWAIPLVLLVFVVIVAWPSKFYFLNDDFIHIPIAGKGFILENSLLRPVSDISLWIDFKFAGKNPFGYHLTNLLIHIGNSVLLYIFLIRFYSINQVHSYGKKALFCSSLFLVYAFHSESIFWIIGRGGSLTTLFALLSLIFLVYFPNRVLGLAFALFTFILGFFTYETIWALPFILGLAWYLNINLRITGTTLVSFGLTFLMLLCVRFAVFAKPLDEYEAGALLSFDIFKLLYNGAALFSRCFIPPMANSFVFLGLVGALLVMLFIILSRGWNRFKSFYILGLLVSLFPVMSLGIDTHDSESERFIYFSTVFAILFITEFLFTLRSSKFFILGGLLLTSHCLILYSNSLDYQFSGLVSKQSLACLKNVQAKRLVLYNLPTQHNGALIFRIGLPAALKWMNDQKFELIEVKSTASSLKKFSVLNCNNITKLESNRSYSVATWTNDSLLIAK